MIVLVHTRPLLVSYVGHAGHFSRKQSLIHILLPIIGPSPYLVLNLPSCADSDSDRYSLLVEIKLVCLSCLLGTCNIYKTQLETTYFLSSLDLTRVCILEICLDNVVSVLANSSQTGLLHDRSNNSAAQRIITHDKTVQVHLW